MNIDAYCIRIGYTGARSPTLRVLREIARLHPLAIPFENLSVAAGGVPELAIDAVEAKLVGDSGQGGRGGYCYEQNALLQAALVVLGFTVTGLSARVRYRLPPELAMPRSHMVLCVDLPEGHFLVDAGFGGLTLTAPVLMATTGPQPTPHELVRLVPAEGDQMLQAWLGDEWVDVYRFDLSPHLMADYEQQNWHTATRPGALFSNNLIAARPVVGGRHTLYNRTLTWLPLGGSPERRPIESNSAGDASLREVLQSVFGIIVNDADFVAISAVSARGQARNPSFG